MSASPPPLRVYLVDDEPLALKRLTRLLGATGRVEIVGSATDPEDALSFLSSEKIDLLFLDIQMPGMNGFELLARLAAQPPVVFTTAFDHYALRAFEVNSIDYLLKPIEAQQLDRAIAKIERLRGSNPVPNMAQIQLIAEQLAAQFRAQQPQYLNLIPSRLGDKIQFIEAERVTHLFAEQKLTFAATAMKNYVIDYTITELEQRLDPNRFIRIHRSTIVNLSFVHEIDSRFAGGMVVRLKDEKRTELVVARDRVRILKERLGF
jgi:two-component system, LytTR family, response regulator